MVLGLLLSSTSPESKIYLGRLTSFAYALPAPYHSLAVIPIPDTTTAQVLKTSVLYGANGAGKSNLFKALDYLKTLVLKPRQKNRGTGREVFAENTSELPSRFDLQFITQGKHYRFGCAVTDQQIIEEWLVQVIGGQEKAVYERITDEDGKVGNDRRRVVQFIAGIRRFSFAGRSS